MKKVIWAIIIIIILVLVVVGVKQSKPQSNDIIRVGAILPLTGSASLWGESVKNGIELALKDHSNIEVIYEDSRGTAADGLSAYNSLLNKDIDVFIASLSVVTVPLSHRNLETKIPMLVTQSAASNLTNEYTFRYYSDAEAFADPAFTDSSSPIKNVKKLAVLYRSDEYAQSVANRIKELSAEQEKEIVFFESYTPNQTDFSTQLTKIKNSSAEAFLFIPTPPSESISILKEAQRLALSIPVIEVSNVMSDPQTRAQAPNITFYTEQFAFSIPGNSEDFKKEYFDKYKITPNFVAGFGFDMINLISDCPKDNIKSCLDNIESVNGVTGYTDKIENHEIIMPMFLMKVN